MKQPIQWEQFARIMLAIKSRGDVDEAELALIRRRCLKVHEQTGVQPGAVAFVLLGALENNATVKQALRLSNKRIVPRAQKAVIRA